MASKKGLLLALLNSLYFAFQACPNGNFTFCSSEAVSCSTSEDRVIAYGYNTTWAYTEKAGGVDLACNDTTFGNPFELHVSQPPKQCCTLTSDLSGTSGLSPVVNTISCGETIEDFFPDETAEAASAHYWRFDLYQSSIVNISNCKTVHDTNMYLRNSTGETLSDTITGCGGDDCGCTPNEEMIDVSLLSGDYYVEVRPRDSTMTGHAGVYYLSLDCESAPPTSAPSNPPTPAPTASPKRRCAPTANNETVWCYDIELSPLVDTETHHTVGITDTHDYSNTYFKINATARTNHCVHPSILFSFEETDFSATHEYIELQYNNGSLIQKCDGTTDCGNWTECLAAPKPLEVDTIKKDETYTITVKESSSVGTCASAGHEYSINAQLTIICSADSASPTQKPTVDPTTDPTVDPTTHDPTFAPIITTTRIITDTSNNDNEGEVVDATDDSIDADPSKRNTSNNVDRTMYIVVGISCGILFVICCVLIIGIYFQRKTASTKYEDDVDEIEEDVELGAVNPDMPATPRIPEDNEDGNAKNNAQDSYLLVEAQSAQVVSAGPRASDANVVNRLTPMGDQEQMEENENEPMILPQLPPDKMGEDYTDGDSDHEDLYVDPKETQGATDTKGRPDDEGRSNDAYNDIYGKGDELGTVEGPPNGNDENDSVDSDDDVGEHNDLYGKGSEAKTRGSHK